MVSNLEIVDDWLSGYGVSNEFISAKNKEKFRKKLPDTIIIHNTGRENAKASACYLGSEASSVSVHLVIGRNGSVYSIVPFNVQAWHTGQSEYNGRTDYDKFSIGIELDNAGVLEKVDDYYHSWFGGVYTANKVVCERYPSQNHFSYWHKYSEVQITTCEIICRLLIKKYSIKHILGHEEISPGRHVDPGPAFPMDKFRKGILSQATDPIKPVIQKADKGWRFKQ